MNGSPRPAWTARVEGTTVFLRTSGAEGVNERLKQLVPGRHRWWDMFYREWRLDTTHWEAVEAMLEREYGEGQVFDCILRAPHASRR